jgi:heme A synthase
MKKELPEMSSHTVPDAANIRRAVDVRVKLSILWVFAILNYIYADVFTEMDSSSNNGSVTLSHGMMLGIAVFMETAMVMVPLARLLKYRANRWANILVGFIHTLAVLGSLFVTGKMPASFYIFFACVEIVTTSVIVWYAWKWTEVQSDAVG